MNALKEKEISLSGEVSLWKIGKNKQIMNII